MLKVCKIYFLTVWQVFSLETNNQTYLDADAPLLKLDKQVTTLLLVIVAVSAVILSLVLTMWAKNRIHETGVYLSVGIRKTAIIGQYLIEVLLIAIIAFGLSYFTSNAISNQIGNSLLAQGAKNVEDIHITIGIDNMIQLYLIGFVVIILSMGAASATVMRLKPREILSKMS